MSVTANVAEKLLTLPESSAIALQIRAEHYFDAIRGILDNFAIKKELDSIYITSTIPSQSIVNALQVLEIDMSQIYFVDCISQIMMSMSSKHEHTIYVESPTMLENLMLKVEYLIKRTEKKGDIVILDSINSLAIHNNTKILSEFLHLLVNNLRAKKAYTVIFSMEEYRSEDISNMLNLVCDETIIAAEE
ncbi:MAG: ATPase domain-containing protein [Thermoplasmata archaeon]